MTVGYRYLAKILAPEGSKDVEVGQSICITVRSSGAIALKDLLKHFFGLSLI